MDASLNFHLNPLSGSVIKNSHFFASLSLRFPIFGRAISAECKDGYRLLIYALSFWGEKK